MLGAIPFPDISPEIVSFELFGRDFALRWYAMGYIVGIALGWQILKYVLRREDLWPGGRAPMAVEQLEDFLTYIIVGVIAGGRLGYVLFYQPGYYLSNPAEILAIWQGGLSFHGGFLGVVAAVWLFARRHGVPLAALADLTALATPLTIVLVRIANFINAELWGRPTDLPWGVIFPGAAAQDCPDVVGLCARHPSQLYEAALEGVVLGLVLAWLAFRRGGLGRQWLLSGVFFAGYGVSRFLVEFVRQPDRQFQSPGNPLGWAVQWGDYGLTMGQLLTLPMIAVGLAVIWTALRR